ncbi:MAG: VOC family protein, partial [Pseudomonadota bacterium]
FAPSDQTFMINLIVDDLDGALAQVAAAGATLHGEPERSEFGAFGWFTDPAGNKIELWQPDGRDAAES